jgi:predicted permease
MLQDIRYAVRVIAKDRWYSAVAVIALALGIGVNATVFTLVNAVLIRGLPFRDSGRLYMLGLQRTDGRNAGVSYADLTDWRAQARTFEGMAAFNGAGMNIADDKGIPEQAQGAWLTADAFRLLGQQPLLGRDFAPDDDRKGKELVVILGYSLWQNRYGGDRSVLGRSIRINSQPGTIIGVMPENMKFPTNAELWANFVPNADQEKRTWRGLGVFGRLKAGVSRSEAQAEMNGIAARLAAEYPDNKDLVRAPVQTFNERFNGGPIRTVFLALQGAVGFVLLIACANVANLLLSRSAHRSREMAVRIALGATRLRVVRQLLVESVLLGCAGGAIGLLMALGGVRLFDAAVEGSGKPYWIIFSVDWIVFGFLAAICVLTGILFGLAPALHVSRTNVNEILKEGGRGTAGGRRARWFSGTMVVIELALTIVLLVGAGLMLRSFMKIYTLDIGIRTENLMSMRLQLPAAKYATADARIAFYDRLAPKLASVPGVDAMSYTTSVPPQGAGRRNLEIDGAPARAPEDRGPEAVVVTISPGFFDTVGVTLTRGRDLHDKDGTPGAETAVVNERLASQLFPNEDPLGRRIRFAGVAGQQNAPPQPWRTIVGVSPSIRHNSPEDLEVAAVVYVPHRQEAPGGAAVLVRSTLPPGSVMHAVAREVQAIDPDQPVFAVQTLDEMLARQRWPFRVFGGLFAIFALIALVLSSVGLYAVMAYSVTARTSEIGVRMALGAAGRQVSWLILRQGFVQLAIGLILGLTGAYFLSRVLSAILVQTTPTDPATFTAITILVVLVSVAACLIPARRATRVDPLVALRAE